MKEQAELRVLVKRMAHSGATYEDIRKVLKTETTDHRVIDELMVDATKYVSDFQLALQAKGNFMNMMVLGVILMVIGIGITAYSIFYLSKTRVLYYGPILVGLYLFYTNYQKYKKPTSDYIPRFSSFRSKRNVRN